METQFDPIRKARILEAADNKSAAMGIKAPKHKAGTTPSWQRPFWVEVFNETDAWQEWNMLKLLVETKMAQSMAEAKRMLEQNIIWIDEAMFSPHGWEKKGDEFESSAWTRFKKIKSCLEDNGKTVFVKSPMAIGIGKTLDDAMCHRITFMSRTQSANW